MSISLTFYSHIFLHKILAPKITKLNVTREKLPKSYKKGELKMLMKLTAVNKKDNNGDESQSVVY